MTNWTVEHCESCAGEGLIFCMDCESICDLLNEVYAATPGLRWSRDGKLQQAWVEQMTGEIDWRDVPTEDSPS